MIEILTILRFISDSGMFVLIWMVQLIAYPVLGYMRRESLASWHATYTKRISLIVIPFMVGQTVIYLLILLNSYSIIYLVQSLLILLVWIHTFAFFVPFHGKIGQNSVKKEQIRSLIAQNWYRTAIWSLVFVLTVLSELIKI